MSILVLRLWGDAIPLAIVGDFVATPDKDGGSCVYTLAGRHHVQQTVSEIVAMMATPDDLELDLMSDDTSTLDALQKLVDKSDVGLMMWRNKEDRYVVSRLHSGAMGSADGYDCFRQAINIAASDAEASDAD